MFKYGSDNFRKEVLHSNIPLDELPSLEVQEIARHGTMAPNGYNLTPGGETNPMDTELSRKKISDHKKKYHLDRAIEATSSMSPEEGAKYIEAFMARRAAREASKSK